jgi:hypothetical protein
MKVEKRAQALIDLDDFAAHLTAESGSSLALRFLNAAEETLELLRLCRALEPCSNARIQLWRDFVTLRFAVSRIIICSIWNASRA